VSGYNAEQLHNCRERTSRAKVSNEILTRNRMNHIAANNFPKGHGMFYPGAPGALPALASSAKLSN